MMYNFHFRIPERRKSVMSYQSSVHFSMKKEKPSAMSMEREKKFRRASLKPVEPEDIIQRIDFSNIGSEENKKSLISTRNSLEVLKESIIRRKSLDTSEDIKLKHHEEETYTGNKCAFHNCSTQQYTEYFR